MTDFISTAPNLIAGAAAVSAWVFVAVYATFSKWRATTPGRSLMGAMASLAALLTMNTIHLATGDYAAINYVRFVVYSALLLSIWRLIFALIGVLRAGLRPILHPFLARKNKEDA
jgi:hypothetical protein